MATVIGFYGRTGPYACLSNFYPSDFEVDGVRFHWSEQYIMFQKAKLFCDRRVMNLVLKVSTPGAAKKLGREVTPYVDSDWVKNREALVVPGLYAKFKQNEDIKQVLLSTGDATIAECSPTDRIWGIGIPLYDERVQMPSYWKGINLLGQYLMTVREMLRQEECAS